MSDIPVEHQAAVNFIGADDDSMFQTDIGELPQFGERKRAARGILWIAENEHPRVRGNGFFHCGKVECAADAIIHMRHADELPVGMQGCGEKRRVDGGTGHYRIIRIAYCAAGNIDPCDQTGQPDNPFGPYLPVMFAVEHVQNSIDEIAGRLAVAEDAVLHAVVESLDDGWRGFEVHVRHPERDDVRALIFVPLEACGVPAFHRGVKIERRRG